MPNINILKNYMPKPEIILLAKALGGQAAYALAGMTLAKAGVFGELSPFGVAFAAAVEIKALPASLFGVVLGYLIANPNLIALRYIAAVAIAAICSYTLRRILAQDLSVIYSSAIAFTASMATGIAVFFTGSVNLPNASLYLAEAVICGSASYFFKNAVEALKLKKSVRYIKPSLLICVLISFGILLLSLEWVGIGGISFARIAAALTVMLAARYSKESGGALAGIASGLTLSLSGNAAHVMSGYAAGGMLAGLFGKSGRFPVALSFLSSVAVCSLISQNMETAVFTIVESAAAALILILLPKSLRIRAEEFFAPSTVSISGDSYKNMLRFRLSAAAASISDIPDSISAAARTIKRLAVPDINSVYNAVENEICSSCVRKSGCWEFNYDSTINAFNDLTSILRTGEQADSGNAPRHFVSNCKNTERLLECFNYNYIKHSAKISAEGKICDLRNAAIDQFSSLSSLLENLRREFSRDVVFDVDSADNARIALESVGINVMDVFCINDENGRVFVQVLCGPKRRRVTIKAATSAMNDTVGIDFEAPLVIEAEDGQSMLLFCEKTNFKVTTGSSQYIGEGQQHCGDAFDWFFDGKGNYNVVLSDGMGTGERAAVDGIMTAGLSSKLIKAGFSFDSVLQAVNSALMVKSKEETLSTLDILNVNLYSGECTFMKAGAATSFIHRKGKTMRVECSSLPLGILRDTEFQQVAGKLADDDIIIIASDGAGPLTKELVGKEIEENKDKSPGEIAAILAKKARDAAKGGKVDDITVIVSQFERKG